MLDAILQARDRGLYTAITDCGAGGLSSAVGEMGEELGAEVAPGQGAAQVRRASATPRSGSARPRSAWSWPCRRRSVDGLLELFAVRGRRGDRHRHVRHGRPASCGCSTAATPVGELDMDFLHDGVPRTDEGRPDLGRRRECGRARRRARSRKRLQPRRSCAILCVAATSPARSGSSASTTTRCRAAARQAAGRRGQRRPGRRGRARARCSARRAGVGARLRA